MTRKIAKVFGVFRLARTELGGFDLKQVNVIFTQPFKSVVAISRRTPARGASSVRAKPDSKGEAEARPSLGVESPEGVSPMI